MERRERTWAVCWGRSGVGKKEDGWAQGLPFLIQLVQPKAWSLPRFLSSHPISQIKCRLSVLRAHFPRIRVLLGFLLVLRITPTPFSVAYNIRSPGASSSSRAPLLPSSLSRTSLAKHTPFFHLEVCVDGLPLPGILKPESSLSSSSKHTFSFLGRDCLTLLSRVCDTSPGALGPLSQFASVLFMGSVIGCPSHQRTSPLREGTIFILFMLVHNYLERAPGTCQVTQ